MSFKKKEPTIKITQDAAKLPIDFTNSFAYVRILDISDTSINKIDISGCRHLAQLICSGSHIRMLDVFDHPSLREVTAKNMPFLHNVYLQDCNHLKNINISSQSNLDIDLRGCINLEIVEASKSKLIDICLFECESLKFVDFSNTYLTYLDLNQSPLIRFVNVSNSPLRNLKINKCHNIQHLFMRKTFIDALDLLHCEKIKTLDVRDTSKLVRLVMHSTESNAAKLYESKLINELSRD